MGDDGTSHPLDRLIADSNGNFSGTPVNLGGKPVRLTAEGEGRWPGTTLEAGTGLTLPVGDVGGLEVNISDQDGTPIPASILLTQGAVSRRIFSVPGDAPLPVAPGTWQASVSRGYEYSTEQTTVEVPEGVIATISLSLEHQVDTEGWLSFDGHVHTAPSPDSTVLGPERARTAAGAGLDVMIHTDHEIIAELHPAVAEAGVMAWVNDVVGEEVTATSPEHTNAWPFPLRPEDPRGEPVRWHGQDIGSIYRLERERGAQVVSLNHPRLGCSLLCLIGWDRKTGQPALEHPEYLGLPADKPLWSWDFDAVEYMNGTRDVTLHPDNPTGTGILDDWLAFLNLGHRVTALGTSDQHDDDDPGYPRTFFPAYSDDPSQFDEQALVDAIHNGQAVVSAGGFARVSANGAGMGELATATDGKVILQVRAEAMEAVDLSRIEVLANCDRIAEVSSTDPDGVVKFDGSVEVTLQRDAYLVVLGWGDGFLPLGLPQFDPTGVPRFTTNPIYVDVDGNGMFDPPGGKECSY